jgi:hypothetical protein
MVTPTEVSAESNNPPVIEKSVQNDASTGAKMSKNKKKNAKKKTAGASPTVQSDKQAPAPVVPSVVRGMEINITSLSAELLLLEGVESLSISTAVFVNGQSQEMGEVDFTQHIRKLGNWKKGSTSYHRSCILWLQ